VDYPDAFDPRHSGQANVGEDYVRFCRLDRRQSILHRPMTMNTAKPVRTVDERCQTFAPRASLPRW
jgi:hypothetical protein